MEGLENKKRKKTIRNKLATWALGALMLLPNANFANNKTKQDISNVLWDEINYNPNHNLDLQNVLNFSSAGVPPKLKSFYKKLWSINKKEDLKNLEFTQREMWFLESWQFMNPDWITKSLWRNASNNLIYIFWWLTKDDTKSFYEDYKSKNPNTKISKNDFEVLSQPIEVKTFSIRAKVDNREYKINETFSDKWYLAYSPSGSLFMCKPIWMNKKEKIYESRFIYNESGKNKVDNIPIRLSLWVDGDYFIQDINGVRLQWWCAIWVDGNLYSVDQDWNVTRKDGKKYAVKHDGFDKSKFVFVRDYSMSGIQKDDITWEIYLLVNVKSSPESMLADKYESKKNVMIIRFQNTELAKQWYELVENDKYMTLILTKNGSVSGQSPEVLSLDFDWFDKRVLSAKESVDKQLDQIESYKIQYQRKQDAFDKFIWNCCDKSEWVDVWYDIVYPISKRNSYFSDLANFNGFYAIQKRESLNDGQPAYITIIDVSTGTKLNNPNQPIFHITSWSGSDVDLLHLPRSILTTIKQYENKKSYISFLQSITDSQKESVWDFEYYINNGISYKWFYIFPSFGFETDREYEIKISKIKNPYWNGYSIKVSQKMTAEDIKTAVDDVISGLK